MLQRTFAFWNKWYDWYVTFLQYPDHEWVAGLNTKKVYLPKWYPTPVLTGLCIELVTHAGITAGMGCGLGF